MTSNNVLFSTSKSGFYFLTEPVNHLINLEGDTLMVTDHPI